MCPWAEPSPTSDRTPAHEQLMARDPGTYTSDLSAKADAVMPERHASFASSLLVRELASQSAAHRISAGCDGGE